MLELAVFACVCQFMAERFTAGRLSSVSLILKVCIDEIGYETGMCINFFVG